MASPIKVTEQIFESCREKIMESVKKAFLTQKNNSKGEFKFNFDIEPLKTVVEFSETAWQQILILTHSRDTEIGWSGTVKRLDDEHFLVEEIYVPPQTVTGATYRTDNEEYSKWLMGMSDDEYNNMKLNGHSHVDMSVSPSSLDLEKQQEIVSQLNGESFYIFMIFNKKHDMDIRVYDFKRNITVMNDEVEVISPESIGLGDFLIHANNQIKKSTYTYTPSVTYSKGKSAIYDNPKDIDDDDYSFAEMYNATHGYRNYSDYLYE